MNKKLEVYGHIFNADLSKVEFVFDSKRNSNSIENGEILIADDAFTNIKYFLRVNNIRYGQNPNWSKEIARGLNFQIKRDDISDEHSSPEDVYSMTRDDQLFLIAECEILGVSNGEQFTSARQLPSYFSRVKKLSESDMRLYLKEFTGDLQIGNIRSGSKVLNIKGGIFKELLSKHIGVFAKTGGGKSNTIKTLLGAIIDTQGEVSSLIFEPHGEYINDLKKHPLATERLVIYNQDGRSGGRKIRISYSKISIESVLSLRKSMRWSEPQERLLFEAYARFGKRWFEKLITLPVDESDMDSVLESGANVFDFADHYDGFGAETIRSYFSNTNVETIRATQSKLRRLANCTFITKHDNQDDLDEIFMLLDEGRSVLVDQAKLNKLEELFLSSLLAGEALKRRKHRFIKEGSDFARDYPPIVIVMEEAQRVLGRNEDSENNVFPQIVNEGRKFLVGLISVTQQPKLMDPVILSQFNTLIILGLSDENDFEILKGSSQNPVQQLKLEIKQLMPGEAIISSPKLPFAMPLKVFKYEDYLKENTDKFSVPTRSKFTGF